MLEAALGLATLVTGIQECGDGQVLKVYVGPRYHHVYVLVEDAGDQDQMRHAWADAMGHTVIPKPPPDALFQECRPIESPSEEPG